MNDLEKAARLALEALETAEDQLAKPYSTAARYAITAIREALAEQPAKQRHIAYVCPQCYWTLEEQPAQQEHKPWCASLSNLFFNARPCDCKRVPLPPPQRKPWVGLTDAEIARVVSLAGFAPDWAEANIATQIVRVCQDMLKEKNA